MKNDVLLILIIAVAGGILRLYQLNASIADWHAWRQADTSSVSRNFVKNGFDILHPRFDDLSNVSSGLDNPQGYRFVEFPLYNLLQAGMFTVFDYLSLESWGRIVSIVSSVVSSIFIYLIVKKRTNTIAAFFSSLFYAILPFNVYFGRTILPDITMVMAILGGIYFFDKWTEDNSKFNPSTKLRTRIQNAKFVLSVIFCASAFLLKPYALFFTLPIIYTAFERFGFTVFRRWQLWLFLIIAIIPLALWRNWMTHYPEGIPVSDWLFNGGDIRFKGSYFYWIFADRIGRLILGYFGIAIFVLGVIRKQEWREQFFFLSFLLSSLAYLTVIARGNVQHDYYQILIVPTIAMYLGLGSEILLNPPDPFSRAASRIIFLVCFIFMLMFGWYFVRDYYNINNPSIITAGIAVDRLTPQDAKIIAPYEGDTSFLYQTRRRGWASFQKPLPDMIKIGADYLVLVNPTEKDYDIGKTYPIVSSSKEYILFDLKNSQ